MASAVIRFLANQIAHQVDRLLNWIAPPIELLDILGADDLADIEAQLDSFEPDELWASHNLPAAAARPPVSVDEHLLLQGGNVTPGRPPYDPVSPPGVGCQASAADTGGLFKSDEVLIEELVADYREFVRDCFRRRG